MTTDTDIAWAAGLFEGEGCFSTWIGDKKYNSRTFEANLTSTDEDIITRFYEIVGVGVIRTNKLKTQYNGRRKQQWTWRTNKKHEIMFIGLLFKQYLGKRRTEKFQELMTLIEATEHSAVQLHVAG